LVRAERKVQETKAEATYEVAPERTPAKPKQ